MKTALAYLFLTYFLFTNSYTYANDVKSGITDEQKIYGLITIWSEVKFGFPYPDKLKSLDWDKKVRDYIPRVVNSQDVEDYYKILMEFASLLEDSHTSVLPPWGYFKPGYDMPSIEIQVIDDKFYISRTGDSVEITSQEILPGTEILEIDKTPIQIYFKENILKYYSQGSKQANDAILVVYLLNGPQTEKVNLKIRDVNGIVRNVVLSRNSANKDGSPFLYQFVNNIFVEQTISVSQLENNILYIKIPNFDNRQIGNDFQALIDSIDSSTVNGLIIDVRYNMGGNSNVSDKIVQCLIDKPISSPLMHYPHYIAANKAWGKDEIWGMEKNMIIPREGKRYLGPIVVITNSVTNSTAEDFAIEMKYSGRATIVGQITAGGAGNTLQFELPFGGTFNLATFKATLPDDTEYIGVGMVPDVEVNPTVSDIINKLDNSLKTSVELLNK